MGTSSAPPHRRSVGSRRRARTLVAATAAAAGLATASLEPSAAAAVPAPPSPVTTAPAAGSPTPRAGWTWPLHPVPAVVRRFEAPPQPWLAGHRGADLAAGAGASVLAPADGTVAFAGPVAGRGVLSLDHPGGVRTTYEPVTAHVTTGQQVLRGQPVATLAADAAAGHCLPVSCLHWGARRGRAYLDPLSLVGAGRPPVLLPLRHGVEVGAPSQPAAGPARLAPL